MNGDDVGRMLAGTLALLLPAGRPGHARGEDLQAVLKDLSLGSGGKTPVVKEFDPAWVRSLTRRGAPQVYTRHNSAGFDYIGMPVGGICSGQLYLGGDGKLWYWDLFNTKSQRDVRGLGAYARPYRRSQPDRRACNDVRQGFAVRIAAGDRTQTRTLDREGFRAAFTSAAGWGTFSQKRRQHSQSERIEVKWGRLRLRSLAFDLPAGATAGTVSASCAGRKLRADFRMEGSRVRITLRKAAIAEAGQALEIEIGT